MPKVIYFNINDNLDYENKLLEEWGIRGLELVEVKDKTSGRFTEYLQDADGLVVEYEQVTRQVMEKCPKLKCISVQSIGYNNLDTGAATDLGICCTNAPGFCADEVAEHTVGLTLDLFRKLTYFDRSVRTGSWDPLAGYKTYRMSGLSFGMVFFGSIPKKIAPVMQALGMKVLVYAPTKTKEYLAKFGCEKAETLNQLLEQSDVVSLHCPLIKDVTYHLMGEEQFRRMKPSAFLINTSRGPVVDERALVKALMEGWIKGAGIDVIEDEMSGKSDLFALTDNVVITPHAAYISEDSIYEGRRIALRQLVERLVEGKRPDNLVNRNVVF